MGIPANGASGTPPAHDQANFVLAGTFTATGQSQAALLYGAFNMLIYAGGGPNAAWTASIQLERSFDGGTTWVVCADPMGTTNQAVYANAKDVSRQFAECERGVMYRLDCTAYTSGTINYRLSTTGQAAMVWGAPSV